MFKFQRMAGTALGRPALILVLIVMLVVTVFLMAGKTAHASSNHVSRVAFAATTNCGSETVDASVAGSQVKFHAAISSDHSPAVVVFNVNGTWFQMPDSGNFSAKAKTDSLTTYFTPSPGAGWVYIAGWSNWKLSNAVWCYGAWSTSVYMP